MRRHSILACSAALSILAVVLPLAATLGGSWQRALALESQALERLAMAAAARGHDILQQVDSSFAAQRLVAGDVCSPVAREQMRSITLGSREIDEIGYYRQGQVQCNSWGQAGLVRALPPGLPMPDSQLWLHPSSFSQANPTLRLVGLYDRGLYAHVEPGRFADITLPDDVQLAVFTLDGRAIAGKNISDWPAAQQWAQRPGPAVLQQDERLLLRRSDAAFRIMVAMPLSQVSAEADRRRRIWAPLMLMLSALGVAVVVGWTRRRLSLAGELRAALAQGELSVHYQPIVALEGGRCVGVEALVRWRHHTCGWISPDQFIPQAEQHGLVRQITRLMMRTVLAELGPTLRAEPHLHVAINLSAADLQADGPLQALPDLLAQAGVAPQQIWLEATERGMVDVPAACAVLAPLRQRGHKVAIDDFGTGYSSLAYLQSLPLDVLKIDKAFVDTVAVAGQAREEGVIQHIIGMARSLGLAVVAEGIENPAQAEWLRARQVDYGQGWVYAKAMPVAQFLAWYRGEISVVSDPEQDQGNGGQ